MSQSGVVSWSQTANSNGTADSNVNWAEGMAPSAVNDSARQQMASVAKWRDDISGLISAGGTSTAYTYTSNQTFSTLGFLNGQRLCLSFNTTNGAAATLNGDTLGGKALQIDSSTALPAGVINVGQRYDISYNSSGGYFLMLGMPNKFGAVTQGAITATSISTSGNINTAAIVASSISTSGDANIAGALTVTGLSTLNGGVAGLIAAQSDQETATSTTLAVSPGRQQFHPSAAKSWLHCDSAGNQNKAYNITSINDVGTGIVDVSHATDFSGAEYVAVTGTQGDGLFFISISNST